MGEVAGGESLMDLNSVVGPVVAAVLPPLQVTVQVSSGQSPDAAGDGGQVPAYETPGNVVASIDGSILTVTAVSAGVLDVRQTLAGSGVASGTLITGQLTGAPGGPGTYSLSNEQFVAPVAMTTSLVLNGSVQPMTYRDLAQLEGINVGGARWKIYLEGQVDGVVRPEKKGGDLVSIPSGPHAGVWLAVQVLEQFPNWVCCAIVLQNRY